MALTRAKAREAFDYVVNVVFQVSKEGPLYRALEKSGDTDIRDMISLRNPDIESLTYDRSDTEKGIPLMRGDKNLLCIFQYYILYHHSIGDPIGQDFWSISTEDFEDYWLGHYLTTLADSEAPPPASTVPNSLQFRPRQYSNVDQAHVQDFVEDLDPGYITRTQDERFMQMEMNFLTSSLSQNAIEPIPCANEDVPSPSPDHAFAISGDDPCIEPLGGKILSNPPNSSTQDPTPSTPQDIMDPLLPSTSQEFVDSAVLESTKFQVHDFLAMVQALSSHPVETHLHADAAVQEKIRSDALLADLYDTAEDADDDLIPIPPELCFDPTTPETLGNPEEISMYENKQSKPASHPVCHALSKQMKSSASPALKLSDEIVVYRKTFCQVHIHPNSISAPKSNSIQSLIACGAHTGIVSSDVHALHKANCGEIYANVSHFGYTGLGTSSSAQLVGYKHSAMIGLAIASHASFLPFLPAVLSAISMAYERPPAAPDPKASAVFSIFGHIHAHTTVFKTTLVDHPGNGVSPMPIFADPTIHASSSTSCFLVNSFVQSAPSRVPCLALLGGEILPPHLPLMQVLADDGEPNKFHPLDSFTLEALYPIGTFVPEDFLTTQPQKFYPLDCFILEDYYPLDSFVFIAIQKDPITLTVHAPMSDINEESKLAKFDCITGSLAYAHPMPVLNISGMDEESLLDKEPKLAQLDCLTGSLACSHAMPVLNLSCTIYWKLPCSSIPSSVIKSSHDDADEESRIMIC